MSFQTQKEKRQIDIIRSDVMLKDLAFIFYSSLWPVGLVEDDKSCWTHFFL